MYKRLFLTGFAVMLIVSIYAFASRPVQAQTTIGWDYAQVAYTLRTGTGSVLSLNSDEQTAVQNTFDALLAANNKKAIAPVYYLYVMGQANWELTGEYDTSSTVIFFFKRPLS